MYITASEYALKHGKSKQWVSSLLKQGRVIGAQKVGSIWFIPVDTPLPAKEKRGPKINPVSMRAMLAARKTII